jgi:diguanylate cyclase (GGDEF)-like protein
VTQRPAPAVLAPGTTHWLSAPLTVRGDLLGTLVAGTGRAAPYSTADLEIVAALAGQGAVALENALLFRRVRDLATTDGLTGLFNRRHFFELAGPMIGVRGRYGRPLAVVMIDIDHFKAVNDTYGHSVGDVVLREVARRLSGTLRGTDLLCRYGGEEFAALLPETTGGQARDTARRLHAAVTTEPVPTPAGPVDVTVSIGLSGPTGVTAGEADLEALLKRADEALYAAKRAGRNRVASAED